MYATEDATNLVILLPFPSLLIRIRFPDATSRGCLCIVNGGTESSSGARYTDRQSDAVQSFAFRYKEASSGRPRCEQPTLDFASGARALDRTGRLRLKISCNKTLTLVRKKSQLCKHVLLNVDIYENRRSTVKKTRRETCQQHHAS